MQFVAFPAPFTLFRTTVHPSLTHRVVLAVFVTLPLVMTTVNKEQSAQ